MVSFIDHSLLSLTAFGEEMYKVISKEGDVSEPLELIVVRKLLSEQTIAPNQMLIDASSGQTIIAAQLIAELPSLVNPIH